MNLNEYQNEIHAWSVSELYLNEYQNSIRVWSVSELYLKVESE